MIGVMDKVYTHMLMVIYTKECSRMINVMAMVYGPLAQTKNHMKAIGQQINFLVKVPTNMIMVMSTLENLKMIKLTGMVS